MKKTLLLFLSVSFLACSLFAQVRKKEPPKKPTRLTIGVATTFSAIDFSFYSQQKRAKNGLNIRAIYKANEAVKLSLEFTPYLKHKDAPSWTNIKASSTDLNFNACGSFSNTDVGFYTILGFSYLNWKGTYTGYKNERVDGSLFFQDQIYKYNKLMLNTGLGVEYPVKNVVFFGELKYRFAKEPEKYRIMINDFSYCFGAKATLLKSTEKKKKGRRGMPWDRYHWF